MYRRAAHLSFALVLTLVSLFALVAILGTPDGIAEAAPSAQATATAVPPTPGPAPKTDRVGYPEGYQNWKQFYVFDREDNKQVRAVFVNDKGAQVKQGQPYPYGTVLVMETWRTKQDAAGNVIKDDKGRYTRDALLGVFVMRKEPGFGVDYQQQRTGEWEYVAFRPDKTYSSPPERSNACAACHLQVSDAPRDWVARGNLFFASQAASAAQPAALPQTGQDDAFFTGVLLALAGLIILLTTGWTLRNRRPTV